MTWGALLPWTQEYIDNFLSRFLQSASVHDDVEVLKLTKEFHVKTILVLRYRSYDRLKNKFMIVWQLYYWSFATRSVDFPVEL